MPDSHRQTTRFCVFFLQLFAFFFLMATLHKGTHAQHLVSRQEKNKTTQQGKIGNQAEPKEIARVELLSLRQEDLKKIDQWILSAIKDGDFPGCVLCVGNKNSIGLLKAYGNRQVEPSKQPMKIDTIFDLASLTKPVSTGLSISLLIQQKKLSLDTPAKKIIQEFGENGKEGVTVLDLLTHQSGLIPDNAIRDYQNGKKEAWKRIYRLPLRYGHRKKFKYSDVGFLVLGKIVEKLSGEPLDQFSDRNFFRPMNLRDTGFRPSKVKADRIAPTEKRNGKWIKGEVHDPRSHLLDGVAGHAGLFSTAPDLAIIAQMILNNGRHQGRVILSPESIDLMCREYKVPGGGIRGLGWDKMSAYSSNRGRSFSKKAIGHGGFTGTVLWIDPEKEIFFILLSNRLHPDGKGKVNQLAGKIATMLGQAPQK